MWHLLHEETFKNDCIEYYILSIYYPYQTISYAYMERVGICWNLCKVLTLYPPPLTSVCIVGYLALWHGRLEVPWTMCATCLLSTTQSSRLVPLSTLCPRWWLAHRSKPKAVLWGHRRGHYGAYASSSAEETANGHARSLNAGQEWRPVAIAIQYGMSSLFWWQEFALGQTDTSCT